MLLVGEGAGRCYWHAGYRIVITIITATVVDIILVSVAALDDICARSRRKSLIGAAQLLLLLLLLLLVMCEVVHGEC